MGLRSEEKCRAHLNCISRSAHALENGLEQQTYVGLVSNSALPLPVCEFVRRGRRLQEGIVCRQIEALGAVLPVPVAFLLTADPEGFARVVLFLLHT